jgi:pimeloyl-ACP methyl ester carboxylesterase
MNKKSRLYYSNKEYLAYNKNSPKNSNKYGIIFLGGFKSDMHGTKATYLNDFAIKNNYDLIRFDYFGHGESSGEFIDGDIGLWLENTLTVIDELAIDKPQILIGSSMGGWMMLLAAMARPKNIVGLIGLAAAADFTEELIWNVLSTQQKEEIKAKGKINFSNEFCEDDYPISLKLITEARNHLLLNNQIPIELPVYLIHGMMDKDVPYSTSIRIAEKLIGNDIKVHLIKDAGHGLSRTEDLEFISNVINDFAKKCELKE